MQDFAAYFRLIRSRLEATSLEDPDAIAAANYPEPVEHCDVCRWWSVCDKRRRDDDHLSLVAGVSRLQSRELQAAGVATLAQLGALPLPLPFTPRRGAIETYVRVREQARVQLAGRTQGTPVHELLPIAPDQGLARLPAPSPGDIFLDLEGDPFARDGGREYLFGLVIADAPMAPRRTRSILGLLGRRRARRVREPWSTRSCESWAANPGMHVYHYAPYEPAAFKRLMGRHATREAEIDRMLRAGLFVDLHAVVKHALRASVEQYSIKDLEPFYGFTREPSLSQMREPICAWSNGRSSSVPRMRSPPRCVPRSKATTATIASLRCACATGSSDCARQSKPEGLRCRAQHAKDGAAPEQLDERARRVQALMAALTADVPAERARAQRGAASAMAARASARVASARGQGAMVGVLSAARSVRGRTLDERAAIAGLRFVARVGGTTKSPIDRYNYPRQDTDVREGDQLHLPDGTRFGRVEAIDRVARTIDVKKRGAQADVHPSAVFAHSVVELRCACRSAVAHRRGCAQHGIGGDRTRYRAARELLLEPAATSSERRRSSTDTARAPSQFAARIAGGSRRHGPRDPGTAGGGEDIHRRPDDLRARARGARVGVTAVSHKVIRNLLDTAMKAPTRLGFESTAFTRSTTKSDSPSAIEEITDNDEALARLATGALRLLGGTAWLWARPELHERRRRAVRRRGRPDVARERARRRRRPRRASCCSAIRSSSSSRSRARHPEGADVSALEHILEGHKTIPADRGIFLPETWRLAPSICAFTSEVFYEGDSARAPGSNARSRRRPRRSRGRPLGRSRRARGNQNSSPRRSTWWIASSPSCSAPGARWIDGEGVAHPLTPRRHPRRCALQRPGRAARRAARPARRPRRHGRQVPGPGGAGRHLLDGDVDSGGRAARDGVPVQPQPAERRDLARAVRVHPRREPAPVRARVPEPAADATRECALSLRRDGQGHRHSLVISERTCQCLFPIFNGMSSGKHFSRINRP